MTHNILSLDTSPRTLAHVEEVASGQPWRWLAAGWRDLRRAPGPSLGYGLLFVVASYRSSEKDSVLQVIVPMN
jgi:hypothetical protein